MTAETPTQIVVMPSKGLGQWLMERHISLAFTTYQTNRLCFIGCKADGRLAFHERLFDKPMGLFAQQDRLVMTTRYQIWELENQLASGETLQGADCLYVPSRSYTTGDINAHDIVVDSLRRIVFVNTRFSCLATLEASYSFAPIWQPAFISHLAPEDRSESLRSELFGVCAAIEGELLGLAVAEVFVDSHQQPCAELVSLSVLPSYGDERVADTLIQLLQLIEGHRLDPVSINPLDPQ